MGDPRFRGAVTKTFVVSALLLAALIALTVMGLAGLTESTLAGLPGWLVGAVEALLGTVAAVLMAWFLFPLFASLIVSAWLEDIVSAVEAKHYPGNPTARKQPVAEVVFESIKFLILTLALNLLALPLYVIIVGLVVYYLLNGFLVGREYFDLVALRRVSPSEARQIRRRSSVSLFAFGVFTTFLLTIPVINLVAPLLATAAMVHLYESRHPTQPEED